MKDTTNEYQFFDRIIVYLYESVEFLLRNLSRYRLRGVQVIYFKKGWSESI